MHLGNLLCVKMCSKANRSASPYLVPAVPGLKWGAAAFAVYVAYDQITGASKKEAHH